MLIDPATLNLVQNTFLQHLSDSFDVVSKYALDLLYIFATLEIVIFGLLWALQQNVAWEKLIFKIIKIGLIFFIIQSYPLIFGAIVKSFITIGGNIVDNKHFGDLLINPAKIWKYGYDVSIGLLKLAANGSAIGLVLIHIILGMGILLVFGLFGIQIVLQMVGLYLVAIISLILLPFGAFNLSSNMLEKSLQSIFKAGTRVMTLIIITGIAMLVFTNFSEISLAMDNPQYNINQPLGLFFTALLFLYLAIKLPNIAAETVGAITMRSEENHTTVNISRDNSNFAPTSPSSSITPNSALSTIQAATNVASGVSASVAVQTATATSPILTSGKISANISAEAIARHLKASELGNMLKTDETMSSRTREKNSISASTLKKLHNTLEKLLQG